MFSEILQFCSPTWVSFALKVASLMLTKTILCTHQRKRIEFVPESLAGVLRFTLIHHFRNKWPRWWNPLTGFSFRSLPSEQEDKRPLFANPTISLLFHFHPRFLSHNPNTSSKKTLSSLGLGDGERTTLSSNSQILWLCLEFSTDS